MLFRTVARSRRISIGVRSGARCNNARRERRAAGGRRCARPTVARLGAPLPPQWTLPQTPAQGAHAHSARGEFPRRTAPQNLQIELFASCATVNWGERRSARRMTHRAKSTASPATGWAVVHPENISRILMELARLVAVPLAELSPRVCAIIRRQTFHCSRPPLPHSSRGGRHIRARPQRQGRVVGAGTWL